MTERPDVKLHPTSSARGRCRRVVIVDDHEIVRWGLRQLFEGEHDFSVCGEAASAGEAFETVEAEAPDLVVTDVILPGRSGLDLIKQLHTHRPSLPVVAISVHEAALYADRALAAGARGYVTKGSSSREITRAARAVLAGRTYVNRADQQTRSDPTADCRAPLAERLTDRELEVFLLLGQGYAPRHIADQLSLSTSTVEVYRQRMKDKLGLESSALLLRYAIQWRHDRTPAPAAAEEQVV